MLVEPGSGGLAVTREDKRPRLPDDDAKQQDAEAHIDAQRRDDHIMRRGKRCQSRKNEKGRQCREQRQHQHHSAEPRWSGRRSGRSLDLRRRSGVDRVDSQEQPIPKHNSVAVM